MRVTKIGGVQPEKLAFCQLNYSGSVIRFRYCRIIGFTAIENFAGLRIQILPLKIIAFVFNLDL